MDRLAELAPPSPHPASTAPGAPSEAPRSTLRDAFAALAGALGELTQAPLDDGVAERCAQLWRERLLFGENGALADRLRPGLVHAGEEPVVLRGVGVHLVCPHHLTVALGQASLAYLPAGHVAGLGALAELLEASCARLVLQEDAAAEAASALVAGLGARAAVVRIEARHPCHALTRPRSHAARVACWGSAGAAAGVGLLRPLLSTGRRP